MFSLTYFIRTLSTYDAKTILEIQREVTLTTLWRTRYRRSYGAIVRQILQLINMMLMKIFTY
jgi:hypothetical protein